jgi:hypothetical protein
MRPLVATGLLALLSLIGACGTSAPLGGGPSAIAGQDTAGADAASCTPLLCDNASVCTTAGTCAPMFPHKYVFTLQKASVQSYNSEGKPWHDDGTNPNVSVRVMIDDKQACETPVANNNLKPEWNLPCEVVLKASTDVRFDVYDHGAKLTQITMLLTSPGKASDMASELRNGELLLQDNFAALFVAIAAP